MDRVDKEILTMMQDNARITNTEIAKRLEMAPSAILERIRKLEKNKLISKYRTQVNPEKVGLDVLAFVVLTADVANWSQSCGEKLASIPNIEEVHEILGKESYLIKIRAKNMRHLSDILTNQVASIPEVTSTATTMVINTLKEGTVFPIEVTKR